MLRSIATAASMIVFCVMSSACNNEAESSKRNRFADPAQSPAEVAEKAEETTRAAESFARQKKHEFEERIQTELRNFDNLIADLRIKAKSAEGEAKSVLNQAIEDLEKKKEALQERLAELDAATADASERIQAAVEAALDDLRESYDEAASELR